MLTLVLALALVYLSRKSISSSLSLDEIFYYRPAIVKPRCKDPEVHYAKSKPTAELPPETRYLVTWYLTLIIEMPLSSIPTRGKPDEQTCSKDTGKIRMQCRPRSDRISILSDVCNPVAIKTKTSDRTPHPDFSTLHHELLPYETMTNCP